MSLVNMRAILKDAVDRDYGVPAFNITTWETYKAVLQAAEEEQAPIIAALTPKFLRFLGPDYICPIIRATAEKSKLPIVLHLDHGKTEEDVRLALDNGFTSVMIDGSMYPLEENIRVTNEIMKITRPLNISVEGELGALAWAAKQKNQDTSGLTDPDAAAEYVEKTGVDALAVSVGNSHGIYLKTPTIDYPRLKKIFAETNQTPLVLHGGTGTPGIPNMISCGIKKVNINSAFQLAYRKTLEGEMAKPYVLNDFSDVITTPLVAALKEVAVKHIREFRANHKA